MALLSYSDRRLDRMRLFLRAKRERELNTIGRSAMIAAGAVVTKNVRDYALMAGVPARQIGWVCECGKRLEESHECSCGRKYRLGKGGNLVKI